MANSNAERRAYCPISVLVDEEGNPEVALDVLSASYEGLRDQNIICDTVIITDSEVAQPDAIAHKFYGQSQLWWIICSYNGILDPYTELVPGTKLLVPRLDEVMIYLTRDSSAITPTLVNRVGAVGEI